MLEDFQNKFTHPVVICGSFLGKHQDNSAKQTYFYNSNNLPQANWALQHNHHVECVCPVFDGSWEKWLSGAALLLQEQIIYTILFLAWLQKCKGKKKSSYKSFINSFKNISLYLTLFLSCLKTTWISASSSLWSTSCQSEVSQAVSSCPHCYDWSPVALYIWHCHYWHWATDLVSS